MSSFALRRRIALGAGGLLAAALLAAPAAQAQFTLAECQGALAPGSGATFQNNAFNGFKAVFSQEPTIGCGSAAGAAITWTGTGSGAGRQTLGERNATANPLGQRDPNYRWAGADEPPNATQRQQIETGPVDANGVDVTAADNGKLHVIPVAIGAIAVIVNLPAECDDFGTAQLYRQRPKTTLANLERVWYGDAGTWGDLIPGIDSDCASLPVKRIVRKDSSGSTFAFKQLLANINPAHTEWHTLGNTAWPPTATIDRPGSDGGGALATLVGATAGSIGYVDLATARSNQAGFTYQDGQFDRIFWLPLQRAKNDADTYDDPQADPDGYKTGNAARGANCGGVTPRSIPGTPAGDPTLGDWSNTDSTLSATGYAACTLTYDLAFEDNAVVYCNSAAEQAKARTVKDYLSKAVISTAGQNSLPASDYDRLPGSVYAIAAKGVSEITWNQGGAGRPCQAAADPGNGGGGGGDTTLPPPGGSTTTPPPPAVSNAFTIASARVSGTSIRVSLQLPGAGAIRVASSTKPKKGKTINLAAKNVTVSRAGAQPITVSLSSKAKSALKKQKSLKVTLKITYTPTGGTAKTLTKNVTVKQPKKKK